MKFGQTIPYHWYRRPASWPKTARNLLREVRWFGQRGVRGWADCDTWSLDHYLLGVMSAGIEHLRQTTHGYPGNDAWPTPEAWDQELREIVAGLKAGLAEDEIDPTGKTWAQVRAEEQKLFDEFDKAFVRLHKAFWHLWD